MLSAVSLMLSVQLSVGFEPLLGTEPNPEAPAAVSEGFGKLVGSWQCESARKQPDDSWQDQPGQPTWTFYYALDGHAVQDVWIPPEGAAGAVGTNLRTYDPETETWHMVWATASQARFDHFTAQLQDNGDIVMRGDRWARAAFGEHTARITFHNISAAHFDWRYEASTTGEEESWGEIVRISCDRE